MRKGGTARGWLSSQEDAARSLLLAVIESSDDAIVTKNLDGIVTSWNRAAERIFGFTGKEMVGRHITRIIPENRRSEEAGILQRLRRGERIEHFETVRRAKDGRLLDVSITVSPIKDDRGVIVGASKIARDITSRKHDEGRWKFLTDATTAFSLSLDLDSTCRNIVRNTVPALADFGCLDLVTADGIARVACMHRDRAPEEFEEIRRYAPLSSSKGHPVSRALATGRTVFVPNADKAAIADLAVSPAHARLLQGLGLRSMMTVVLAARGKTLGALTLYQSDSNRRDTPETIALAEEYARRASEALENALLYRDAQQAIADREKFLSIASHELRTPLTTLQLQLQGALRILRKEHPDALKRSAVLVANAERQGSRIGKLITELLDISRISAGKLRLQMEGVDLAELVRDVAEHFQPELAEKGIRLAIQAPKPVRGKWDRFRIDQVITNLIANAVKYGDGKPVSVTVDSTRELARIAVQDEGMGMDPAFLKRIFRPFEQGQAEGLGGGLGLGLFIARQIVDSHDGRITVTSRPGQGSLFTVELPRDLDSGARNERLGGSHETNSDR